MDGVPQEQQAPSEQKKNGLLEEVEFGVGGIMLGVGTFLLMLFVLNYFNLVSLSLVFPKYFGWLPHRASQNPPAGGEGGPSSQTLYPEQSRREQGRRASPTPTPPFVTTLESCDVKKEGNPLVESVKTIKVKSATGSAEKEIIVGDFRGNIGEVTFDSQKTTASIKVISQKGEQTHTFNLKGEEGLVYDVTLGKDLQLSDLAVGQTVTMSFNCSPDQPEEKQFKITRVSITGKL